MVSLRLLGSGIPDNEKWDRTYGKIRSGWERYLARLKNTLENPPGPKPKPVSRHLPLRGRIDSSRSFRQRTAKHRKRP
jgi:hypothetical protein